VKRLENMAQKKKMSFTMQKQDFIMWRIRVVHMIKNTSPRQESLFRKLTFFRKLNLA